MILGTPEAIDGIVRKTCWDNLDLIPASLSLQRVDLLVAREPAATTRQLGSPLLRLRQGLQRLADRYDVIVVDTPPALGMLSLNAIAAVSYTHLDVYKRQELGSRGS